MAKPGRGLFITGTDTGVGKTVVTAALAVALSELDFEVGVMKPVESGCARVQGALVPEDAVFLRKAAGSDAPMRLVNPYALRHPLAPALAAEMEGVAIEMETIEKAYATLIGGHDIVLVEGAGGLLAPLSGDLTMLDLAARLGLPVLVVAKNTLGTINHTALTVRAAKSAGLTVLGVVLSNPTAAQDEATATNPDSLRRWAGTALLGEVAHLPSLAVETLGDAARQMIDMDRLMNRWQEATRTLYRAGGRS